MHQALTYLNVAVCSAIMYWLRVRRKYRFFLMHTISTCHLAWFSSSWLPVSVSQKWYSLVEIQHALQRYNYKRTLQDLKIAAAQSRGPHEDDLEWSAEFKSQFLSWKLEFFNLFSRTFCKQSVIKKLIYTHIHTHSYIHTLPPSSFVYGVRVSAISACLSQELRAVPGNRWWWLGRRAAGHRGSGHSKNTANPVALAGWEQAKSWCRGFFF